MRNLILILSISLSSAAFGDSFKEQIVPFLNKYCLECHGGKKVKGKVDFTKIKSLSAARDYYKIFESGLELIHEKEMPPEDEPQPSKAEIAVYEKWYEKTFIQDVKARPAEFKAR